MTKWLVIGNDGELDPTALRLVASTKQGEQGKIGKFGLGWKQALAALMRLNCRVNIVAGTAEYVVGTAAVEFRGQQFEEVVITDSGKRDHGENFSQARESDYTIRTGVTTALAREWKPWMAIREVVANAIDEGGYSATIFDDDGLYPHVVMGRTNVFISATPEILQVWEMWRKYFRAGEAPAAPEAATPHGRLLASLGDGVRIYKQGILVYEDEKRNALWDYDLPTVRLGEDRIAQWWDVVAQAEHVLSALPIPMRRKVLMEMGKFEEACVGETYGLDDPDGWADAIPDGAVVVDPNVASHFTEELGGQRLIKMPGNCVRNITKAREAASEGKRPRIRLIEDVIGYRADGDRKPVSPTRFEKSALSRAAKAARPAGIEIDPRAVVVFEGGADGVLGMADGGKIWVSRECLKRGLREVLKTLIEEHAHIESGAKDKTRSMQEVFLEMIVRAIESRRRSPL